MGVRNSVGMCVCGVSRVRREKQIYGSLVIWSNGHDARFFI